MFFKKAYISFLFLAFATSSLSGMGSSPNYTRLQKVVHWVKENPKKTIFGALTAGYLAGTPGGQKLVSAGFETLKELSLGMYHNPIAPLGSVVSALKEKSPSFGEYSFGDMFRAFGWFGLGTLGFTVSRDLGRELNKRSKDRENRESDNVILPQSENTLSPNFTTNDFQKACIDNGWYGKVSSDIENLVDNIVRKKNKMQYVTIPKGFLFQGPPGNGKTLLAKVITQLSGVPLITLSSGTCVGYYQGSGAASVNDVFNRAEQAAQKHGHAILLIDEVDAISQARDKSVVSKNQDRNAALLTLTEKMDGIFSKDKESNITVIFATNRKNDLDTALIRPGRIDYEVEFENPDQEDRTQIFCQSLRRFQTQDEDQNSNPPFEYTLKNGELATVINSSDGFSAAECFAVVNKVRTRCLQNRLRNENAEPSENIETIFLRQCNEILKNKPSSHPPSSQNSQDPLRNLGTVLLGNFLNNQAQTNPGTTQVALPSHTRTNSNLEEITC